MQCRLTPLEVCALTFLTDGLATIGGNVCLTMKWQNLLAMLVLLLAASDWHVPQHLPFHSLMCRTLSCMCCYVLRSAYPMLVAVAFFVPTFGKQGRLSFAPSSAAKPASASGAAEAAPATSCGKSIAMTKNTEPDVSNTAAKETRSQAVNSR